MAAGASVPGVEHRFVQANGLRFHVAECGEGDRLALCLHGFPQLWLCWREQMPLLARLGYRVWAPDLRGYGQTERPARMQDYDLDHLRADVAGLIDASGAREVTLLAHDWGGIIAWLFAMRPPRPLERLVVMNAPHPGPARRAARTWRQLARSWYVLFFQLPWLPEKLLTAGNGRAIDRMFRRSATRPDCFPDDVIAAYREAVLQPGAASAMVHYYRMLLRGPAARRERGRAPARIETPTLVLWGDDDVALTRATIDGVAEWVPDVTVRHLPGISHWVQEEAPETVNAMLAAWLTGAPVPDAPA